MIVLVSVFLVVSALPRILDRKAAYCRSNFCLGPVRLDTSGFRDPSLRYHFRKEFRKISGNNSKLKAGSGGVREF